MREELEELSFRTLRGLLDQLDRDETESDFARVITGVATGAMLKPSS